MDTKDDEVWAVDLRGKSIYSRNLGTVTKYHGHPWRDPKTSSTPWPSEVTDAAHATERGEWISPDRFPEAAYVYSERDFSKTFDFLWSGGFIAVKERFSSVLLQCNL